MIPFKIKTNLGYKTWFTSDWHLGHKNIISFAKRPFSGVAEMERVLIENHNSVVEPNDKVFFLGDFCWHKSICKRVIHELNGKWVWISGNHDKDLNKYLRENDIEYFDRLDITVDDHPITLSHHPMVSWNKSHFGAWQLFGHHHWDTNSSTRFVFRGPKINVTVENFNYFPVEISEIKEMMESRDANWDLIRNVK